MGQAHREAQLKKKTKKNAVSLIRGSKKKDLVWRVRVSARLRVSERMHV